MKNMVIHDKTNCVYTYTGGYWASFWTTPDALDLLLQIPGCLRLAAKLRGGSAKLQINIIVDSVAQKHSPVRFYLPTNFNLWSLIMRARHIGANF